MLFHKPVLHLMAVGTLVLFVFAVSAMADPSPIDPHALFADGGDATGIGAGATIVLSSPPGTGNNGGGIFVYNNDTGSPLEAIEVDITLPNSFGAFSFTGTIFTPVAAAPSISSQILFNQACGNPATAPDFCVEMTFSVNPGPLVPAGGNFVLDFDKPTNANDPHAPPIYGGVDEEVATGNYTCETCGTDTSDARVGEWSDGAVGFVTPFIMTPEPRQYAGMLAGILALAIFLKRKRNAVAQ